MSDKHELSDRELLLLIAQRIDEKLPIIDKRLDSHASDIKGLREWRNYSAGALAALATLLGIKHHGG